MDFDFRTVPSIHVEWSGARRLGRRLAPRFAERNLLVVTDAGLVEAGVVEPALRDLRENGFAVSVYDGIVADPPEDVLSACVAVAREREADLILGLGGGSSLDIAKLTAVLARGGQAISDLYGIDRVQGSRLPLVLVPTTAGTGSEVTDIAIVTTSETTKMGVVSPRLYADEVLLDAELKVGLPRAHTAATGIDAMVHAIEATTSRHRKNPMSDALAREALRLLSANLIRACRDGGDRMAREAMLLGAMLAGQAFANAPVAAVHALAYPLGGHFHIPHGLANALMLAPVLRFNAPAVRASYAGLADVVGAPPRSPDRAQDFLAFMQALIDESGAPRRLRDVGVGEDVLARLAADAMAQTRLLANNPVEVTEADALRMYREAF